MLPKHLTFVLKTKTHKQTKYAGYVKHLPVPHGKSWSKKNPPNKQNWKELIQLGQLTRNVAYGLNAKASSRTGRTSWRRGYEKRRGDFITESEAGTYLNSLSGVGLLEEGYGKHTAQSYAATAAVSSVK